jgi:hypothetical protein
MQTDMMKPIVTFHNFVNKHKKGTTDCTLQRELSPFYKAQAIVNFINYHDTKHDVCKCE